MRLQKFLAQSGIASRRAAERLIAEGKVRVNGEPVTALGARVTDSDRVEVEGRRVRPEAPLYRILLKPRSCLSTLGPGPDGRTTLSRYVNDGELGWKVVAPLDFPAEGVVLLTTDGELAERMSRGGGHVPMTYHVKFQGAIGAQELERLRRGWRWMSRAVRPTKVEPLATTGKNTWIGMVVAESRPRVLKAAGESIHRTVLKISRVRLGPVSFEGLKMGEHRDLTKGEINAIRRDAGVVKTDA